MSEDTRGKSTVKIEFQLPTTLHHEILAVIKMAPYRDWQQFLETSVRNQLTLESTRGASDLIVSDQNIQPRFPTYRELGRTWDMARLHFLQPIETRLLSSPHMPFSNRIFPVKVATRVLCNLLEDQADLGTEPFGETLFMVAQDLGRYLLGVDRAMEHRLRLEALSTGFPVKKREKLAKSKRRFLQHFVGSVDSSGRATGMMLSLGFATIATPNRIGVTEEGSEFARLENPILDTRSVSEKLGSDLSVSECKIYLETVERRLPAEARAMKTILTILANGSKSYQEILNEFAKSSLVEGAEPRTIVSSLLGRMRELMLIRARQEGLKTFYDLQ